MDHNADATTGSGYCDAQSTDGACNEMDVSETNLIATQLTSHGCSNGVCDKDGVASNIKFSEKINNLDTSKPFTLSTSFDTNNNIIKQNFIQNNNVLYTISISNNLDMIFKAFDVGMVLVLSLWTDPKNKMSWLNGPCANYDTSSLVQSTISNIKITDIN